MSDRPRVTVLLGAGFPLIWNSPSTSDITKHLLINGFRTKGGKQTVTQALFDKVSLHVPQEKINFETILHIIESYIQHYSLNHEGYNLSQNLFCADLMNIVDYKANYLNGKIDSIIIRDDKTGQFNEDNHNNVFKDIDSSQPEIVNYLMFLYSRLIVEIIVLFNKSYTFSFRQINNKQKEYESKSKRIWEWYLGLLKNKIVRVYTLNYDYNLPIIAEHNGMDIFTGFEWDNDEKLIGRSAPELISSNYDVNCYYNLHGSIHWHPLQIDYQWREDFSFGIKPYPEYNQIAWQKLLEVNQFQKIYCTNITSGYNKTTKSFQIPIRQMFNAFDRDCLVTDEIIIIGYSFSDEHVNLSIKMAMEQGATLKIISPDALLSIEHYRFLFNFISRIKNSSSFPVPEQEKSYFKSFFGGKLQVYNCTFEQFLSS